MGAPARRPSVSLRLPDAGQALVLVLLVGTPVALFVALRAVPSLDVLFQSVLFHLVVVSSIAGCALLVAVLTAVAAARVRQFSLVMLSLGCVFVGFAMLTHALTTPGIFGTPGNLWVARLPTLALAAFAACQAAALVPPHRPVPRLVQQHALAAVALPAVVTAAACGAAIAWPDAWIGGRMLPGEETVLKAVATMSALSLFLTGYAHGRRWQLSKDRMELAMLLACWLATEAVVSLQLGRLWHLSWWDYHALLLVGFVASVAAVLSGYRRTRTLEGALTGLVLTGTLERIAHGYPEAIGSLVTAVETRDAYTRGHSARVAALSVRIGERMGLRPESLRGLAHGGMLHDIGKIGVPDHILNKPAILTSEERAMIQRHPAMGWEIVRQSPSLRGALAVVRYHHERLDGTGYPDHLAGHEIPLEARIAAVADVWDALTSDRAYRSAFPTDQALEIMLAGRGSQLDPDPLDVLLELLEAEGIRPIRRVSGGIREGIEACHPDEADRVAEPAGTRRTRGRLAVVRFGRR